MSDGPLSFRQSWEGFLPPNTVLMARRRARPSPSVSGSPRFGFEAPDMTDPAARALFDKILAALELSSHEIATFPKMPEGFTAPIVVRLVATESDGERAGAWDGEILTTYSLGAMLGNPGLKKLVWAHLKDALGRGRE
jgi:hypothetical protein